MQLDLFRSNDTEFLKEELRKLKSSTENVRKGMFSRFNSLEKIIIELEKKHETQAKEIDELKAYIQENSFFNEVYASHR